MSEFNVESLVKHLDKHAVPLYISWDDAYAFMCTEAGRGYKECFGAETLDDAIRARIVRSTEQFKN